MATRIDSEPPLALEGIMVKLNVTLQNIEATIRVVETFLQIQPHQFLIQDFLHFLSDLSIKRTIISILAASL